MTKCTGSILETLGKCYDKGILKTVYKPWWLTRHVLQSMFRKGISTTPWIGIVGNHPTSFFRLPFHFPSIHLHVYTWVESGPVRVRGLAQEHNTMTQARAHSWIS